MQEKRSPEGLDNPISGSKIPPISGELPDRSTGNPRPGFMTPSSPSPLPEKKSNLAPCKHPRVQIVAREEDAEFVECKECGEVFEASVIGYAPKSAILVDSSTIDVESARAVAVQGDGMNAWVACPLHMVKSPKPFILIVIPLSVTVAWPAASVCCARCMVPEPDFINPS